MKHVSSCLLAVVLLSIGGRSQDGTTAERVSGAEIEGIVTRDPDGQPLKKVIIELIATSPSGSANYTTVTGLDGIFRIENIVPGRYHLFAERIGFLDVGNRHFPTEGRLLTLAAGQQLKELRLHLQAAAVVRGRVTDEDGDPLPNAEVSVLRRTFVVGHSRWDQAAAERTNDLGEYRISGLPAGEFYVSVGPPPDFRTLIETANTRAGTRNAEKTSTAYQMTYYPGTSDRSQAAPIQLHAGDDFPVNFSLTPAPALSISGAVVNLPPRTSATVMLQSRDFGLMLNGANMRKDGTFEIRDVSPGSYTILATVEGSAVPMSARQTLQVGSANVNGLRLVPQPGATVHGRLRMESGNGSLHFDANRVFLALESTEKDDEDPAFMVGQKFSNIAHVSADGTFEWTDVPQGSYYVTSMDEAENQGWYLKSVVAGGREVSDSGLLVNGAALAIDLTLSANAGAVTGVVTRSKGEPVPNAVVVVVPEARMRSRTDRFRMTVTDQAGQFMMRGIRAGEYTVFAWEKMEGEEYYDPDFLKTYEAQGMAIHVAEGEQKNLQISVISQPEEQ